MPGSVECARNVLRTDRKLDVHGVIAGEVLETACDERLACPVWQESFGARAGFPQDHPLFAGHLPADRGGLRDALAGRDLVLVVGAPVFRQYPYAPGPFVEEGTTIALVTDDPREAHRSPAALAVLAAPAAVCAALAERLPPETVLIEETPSSRPELHALIPARRPLGFLSAAMGGLGFAMPGAIGVRMALPDRPVVVVVGDGSSLYAIQALWSAAEYDAGVLFVVLSNGGYAVMDRLAEQQGGTGSWPSFNVDVCSLARGLGCPAARIDDHSSLVRALDEHLPGLADRSEPLLLEVAVSPGTTFRP